MMHDAMFAIWILLPAGAANAAPVFAAAIPGLSRWSAPVDGGKWWRGKPILGPHKTWRGFAVGMLISTLVFWLEQRAAARFDWAASIVAGTNFEQLPVLIVGPLLGLGALGGDALASFFKRRRGTAAGQSWIPFDQLDYIVGAIVVTLPFMVLPVAVYIWMFVIWFGIHLAASFIGWRLGLKEAPI